MKHETMVTLGFIFLLFLIYCCPYFMWFFVGIEILWEVITQLRQPIRRDSPSASPIDPLEAQTALFMYTKAEYLKSKEWQNKRKAVLKRDNYTCQNCKATGVPLHVHHKSGYDLIPNEPLSCLVTLCADCHKAEHDRHGYPKTYIDYMNWGYPSKNSKNVHLEPLNI